MTFWRRGKPLHRRLAEEAGLLPATESGRDLVPWHQAGVHGVPRPRRWDAVVTAEADVPGDDVRFVALEDRTLLTPEDVPEAAVEPLAEAVEAHVAPPYRAEARRRGERLWAVGANRIRVARLEPEIPGDEIELAVREGVRTLLVDGAPRFGSLPSLEALAGGMSSYAVRAERLEGDLWEVRLTPL